MGVWAWGAGGKGQLGSGGLEDSPAPVPVPSLGAQDLKGVACGGSHALALLREMPPFLPPHLLLSEVLSPLPQLKRLCAGSCPVASSSHAQLALAAGLERSRVHGDVPALLGCLCRLWGSAGVGLRT